MPGSLRSPSCVRMSRYSSSSSDFTNAGEWRRSVSWQVALCIKRWAVCATEMRAVARSSISAGRAPGIAFGHHPHPEKHSDAEYLSLRFCSSWGSLMRSGAQLARLSARLCCWHAQQTPTPTVRRIALCTGRRARGPLSPLRETGKQTIDREQGPNMPSSPDGPGWRGQPPKRFAPFSFDF